MTPERKQSILFGSIAGIVLLGGIFYAYYVYSGASIAVDKASIIAPLITFSPSTSGPLQALYVKEGDMVAANTPLAQVGTQVLSSQVAGLVVHVNDAIGAQITPGTAVVTMIDPSQLRVVGQVDENKGLARIHVGDPVIFTVDAYGSQQFNAVIDEIAPTARSSDVVFSISDKRQEQSFDVKARYDVSSYTYLKNGMSARMWIYKPM